MKNPIRDFFYFPKGDRRAVVIMGSIAVLCISVLIVIDALNGQKKVDVSAGEMEETPYGKTFTNNDNNMVNKDLSLCQFNPNTIDSLTLVEFGIQPWKVRNFLHYRAAGKVFRSADDMGDTYGWTAEDVKMLAPYVYISEEFLAEVQSFQRKSNRETRNAKFPKDDGTYINTGHASQHHSAKFQTLTKIDVNTADSATLCSIPGIGAGISNAIIRYRTRLGGIYSTSQLLEISIFSPDLLEWFIVSDTLTLTKLSINHSSFHALNSHPYITYEQARNLLKYIRLYGKIDNEQTLLSTGIFAVEDIERLRPYIRY